MKIVLGKQISKI